MKFIHYLIAPIVAFFLYGLSIWQLENNLTFEGVLLTTLISLAIDILLLQIKQNKYTKKILDTNEITIEIFEDAKSRKAEVEKMYQSSASKIIASHFYPDNYKPELENDIGLKLSMEKNTSVHRIIAINNDEHKHWVKEMYEKSPENYFIRIVEKLPKEPPYPNFVLMEKGEITKLFISFSSTSTEGGFAFTTSNNKLSNGMKGYIEHINTQAIGAEHYFDK